MLNYNGNVSTRWCVTATVHHEDDNMTAFVTTDEILGPYDEDGNYDPIVDDGLLKPRCRATPNQNVFPETMLTRHLGGVRLCLGMSMWTPMVPVVWDQQRRMHGFGGGQLRR